MAAAPDGVTLTTFNVHWGGFGPRGAGRYDLAATSASLPGTVRVFQEVWDHPDEPSRLSVPSGWAELRHSFGRRRRPRWFHLGVDEADRAGDWSLAVVTAHPVLDTGLVDLLPVGRDPRRHGLVVRLATPEGDLTVVAVHLTSSVVPLGPGTQLAGLARRLPAGPLVLAGDHNLWARAAGPLLAGFRLAGRGPTWPAPRPRHQIDHIWVRDLDATGRVLGDLGSDHLPVTATLA